MNNQDIIITALTPGSPFNANNKIWRSVSTLSTFCECEPSDILEIIAGDLGQQVTCKPSTKGKGILVALRDLAEVVPLPEVFVEKSPEDQAGVVSPESKLHVNFDGLPEVETKELHLDFKHINENPVRKPNTLDASAGPKKGYFGEDKVSSFNEVFGTNEAEGVQSENSDHDDSF